MVRRVKATKAGFVYSDSNIRPDATLQDVLDLKDETGHATMAVTEDGTPEGKLLGIITSRDYRTSRMDPVSYTHLLCTYSLCRLPSGIGNAV